MRPIDWPARVADAIGHPQKPSRKLTPEASCEIIDDVVNGELSAGNIAEKHRGRDPFITALGHVTTAVQGGRLVKPLGPAVGTSSREAISPTRSSRLSLLRGKQHEH